MIDIKHLIAHSDFYHHELDIRNKDISLVPKLVFAHEQLNKEITELETLRAEKNEFNKTIRTLTAEQKKDSLVYMKTVAKSINEKEILVKNYKALTESLLLQIPNLTHSAIPIGKSDKNNVETSVHGTKPNFGFTPKPYYELPCFKDYLSDKGVEASGFRGFYIRGELARLQQALFTWALDRLTEKGFEYIIPPVFVNEKVLEGTGFFPAGIEDAYSIGENAEHFLPGTSEAALMFLHSSEELNLDEPKRLMAWTRCFRKEAGSYGKDTKGGIRVTQFEKIETVILCKPEDSVRIFEEMKNVFCENLEKLGMYYRQMEVCSGDISLKNHRQIDIEGWFPGQEEFRELCSASNCTDYQTRGLKIKTANGLAHSLNATGMVNRVMFAFLEQNQQENGNVKIPEVLVPYFGKTEI